jgi:hypothetical protein
MKTAEEILEAVRALPREQRVRLLGQIVAELERQQLVAELSAASGLEERGRLLVYTGPVPDPALDHRVDREERVDDLVARLGPK